VQDQQLQKTTTRSVNVPTSRDEIETKNPLDFEEMKGRCELTITSNRHTLKHLEPICLLQRRDLSMGELLQELGLLVVNVVLVASRDLEGGDAAQSSYGLNLIGDPFRALKHYVKR